MAGAAREPLSVEDAKSRLRAVAREAGPLGWVRRKPLQALALAAAAGLLASRLPPPALQRLVVCALGMGGAGARSRLSRCRRDAPGSP